LEDGFKLFEVYLGSTKRKEDFFTYYLASCLEYCYKQNKELFKEVLVILKLSEVVDLNNFELVSRGD
jgi:hypothetical protein